MLWKTFKRCKNIIARHKNSSKKRIKLIEDYNIKLLSTKVYWDTPKARDEYKEFWNKYKEISKLKETDFIEYIKQKEILFIRNDMKKLPKEKTDYTKVIKYYKRKLVDYGVMKQLRTTYTSSGKYTKIKGETA